MGRSDDDCNVFRADRAARTGTHAPVAEPLAQRVLQAAGGGDGEQLVAHQPGGAGAAREQEGGRVGAARAHAGGRGGVARQQVHARLRQLHVEGGRGGGAARARARAAPRAPRHARHLRPLHITPKTTNTVSVSKSSA